MDDGVSVDWSNETITLERFSQLAPNTVSLNLTRATLPSTFEWVSIIARLPLTMLLLCHVHLPPPLQHNTLLAHIASVQTLHLIDITGTDASNEALFTLIALLGVRPHVRRIAIGRPQSLHDQYTTHIKAMLQLLPSRIELGVTSGAGVDGWLKGHKEVNKHEHVGSCFDFDNTIWLGFC
jgi:hypothetical protein